MLHSLPVHYQCDWSKERLFYELAYSLRVYNLNKAFSNQNEHVKEFYQQCAQLFLCLSPRWIIELLCGLQGQYLFELGQLIFILFCHFLHQNIEVHEFQVVLLCFQQKFILSLNQLSFSFSQHLFLLLKSIFLTCFRSRFWPIRTPLPRKWFLQFAVLLLDTVFHLANILLDVLSYIFETWETLTVEYIAEVSQREWLEFLKEVVSLLLLSGAIIFVNFRPSFISDQICLQNTVLDNFSYSEIILK